MKINKTYPYNLRNDAHFQFYTEFRNLVQSEGAEKLKIAPQFEAWLPLYEREDIALKKIVKSSITAQLQEADKARDEIYIGMVETNNGAQKHFSEEVRSAAARLKIVFGTYGNVARKPLDEETSAITNILQEFEGQYAADIAKVGILPWVVELKARNIAFSNLMKDRHVETADKLDIELKDIRAQVDAAFFAIREQINALVLVEGAAIYEELVKKVNALVAKHNSLSKPKSGKGGEQEDEQTEGGADE